MPQGAGKENLAHDLLRAIHAEAQHSREKVKKPPLRVDIAGASYITADWSLNGVVVAKFNKAVAVGTMVSFKMSDQVKGDALYGGVGEVVKVDPAKQRLVLHFYSTTAGTLSWLGDILFQAEKAAAAPAAKSR